jgi:hypothetical protein
MEKRKMLKRNLIAIVITSLVLIFTSSAFGQWHKDFPESIRKTVKQTSVQSPRDVATGQIKSPRDVASGAATQKNAKTGITKQNRKLTSGLITETGIPAIRSGNNVNQTNMYNPKELSIEKAVNRPSRRSKSASRNLKGLDKSVKTASYIGETEKNLRIKQK